MHSIRETAGVVDMYYYVTLMKDFLEEDKTKHLPKGS